jgi:phosphatidylglycerophosphate synthase
VTKHIPNTVSVIKGLLGLLIPFFALTDQPVAAFWIYAGAVFCDLIDGGLARLLNAESTLGKDWIDPISDGIMSAGAMIGLIFQDNAPPLLWWIGVLMVTIGLTMKSFKHQSRFEFLRYQCNYLLPYCYIGATVVLLNIYAVTAFRWRMTGIVITIAALAVLREIKKGRTMAWAAGLR